MWFVAIYLISGIPAVLLYAWLNYILYFDRHTTSFWKSLGNNARVIDVIEIYVFWFFFLIITLFTFIVHKVIGKK